MERKHNKAPQQKLPRGTADPANPCASGETGEEKARSGASPSAKGTAGLLHPRFATCLFSSFGESWGDLLCMGLRPPCQTYTWGSQGHKLLDLQPPGGPISRRASAGGMLRNQDLEKQALLFEKDGVWL